MIVDVDIHFRCSALGRMVLWAGGGTTSGASDGSQGGGEET